MRKIKFRAWEKNLKEIIPVYDIDFTLRQINTDTAWRLFDEIELMHSQDYTTRTVKRFMREILLKYPTTHSQV